MARRVEDLRAALRHIIHRDLNPDVAVMPPNATARCMTPQNATDPLSTETAPTEPPQTDDAPSAAELAEQGAEEMRRRQRAAFSHAAPDPAAPEPEPDAAHNPGAAAFVSGKSEPIAPTDERLPENEADARAKGHQLLGAVGEMSQEERNFWDKTFVAAVQSGKDVDQASAFGLFSVLARRTLFRAAQQRDEARLQKSGLVVPVPGAFTHGPRVTRGLR